MVKLVGILNITPDSFSDGGQHYDTGAALRHFQKLADEGASIIDIGAESTRPGAEKITKEEEIRRLEPVLRSIKKLQDKPLVSIDTMKPAVAKRALDIFDGEIIINDVSGFENADMVKLVADTGIRIIVCHLPPSAKGNPEHAHSGELIDSYQEVVEQMREKIAALLAQGVRKENVIVDPGIGFGKTPEVNKQLLRFAEDFTDFEVMIGYSRKRFLGENRMDIEPNLAAGEVAKKSGAAYLRVHDVEAHARLFD